MFGFPNIHLFILFRFTTFTLTTCVSCRITAFKITVFPNIEDVCGLYSCLSRMLQLESPIIKHSEAKYLPLKLFISFLKSLMKLTLKLYNLLLGNKNNNSSCVIIYSNSHFFPHLCRNFKNYWLVILQICTATPHIFPPYFLS